MRKLNCLLLACVAAATAAAAETAFAPLVVALRAESVSAGEYVLLGEVAALPETPAGERAGFQQTPVGLAASPGQRRTFTALDVQAALRKAGCQKALEFRGTPAVVVTAAAQTVAGPGIAAAAAAAVRAGIAKDPDLEAEIHITSVPADVTVRPGAFSLDTELAEGVLRPGVLSVRVRVQQAGRVWAEPVVGLKAVIAGSVAVAAERMLPGDILADDGVKFARRTLTAWDLDARCDPHKLIGLRARKIIAAEEPLTRAAFALPQIIKRGDAITVRVRRGGLELAARGEARGDAALDEPVRVLVPDSTAEIIARASGPREATLDDLADCGATR